MKIIEIKVRRTGSPLPVARENAQPRRSRSDALYLVALSAVLLLSGAKAFAQIVGGATYSDSGDFILNTTGLSPIVGGASYADSGDFVLNTTGLSLIVGGAAYADSTDFTLDTGPMMLTITVIGGGSANANPNLASYPGNTVVTLTATAIPGAQFLNWSGDASGTQNPLAVTMTDGKSITANFTLPLTVLNTNDSGSGSLRQAIADTATTGISLITFAPNVTNAIVLTNELDITNTLNIVGPGANVLTVDGNGTNRVFVVASGTVSLSGLTIANGIGGISNSTALSVSNCVISGHQGSGGASGAGSGIYNAGSGTLALNNSTISSNSMVSLFGDTYGAGIHNEGTLRMTNCTVSANKMLVQVSGDSAHGGGIGSVGTLRIYACTLCGNLCNNTGGVAGQGGGIYKGGGSVRIGNTIVASNTVVSPGASPQGHDVFGSTLSDGYNLVGKNNNSSGWIATDQTGTIASPLDARLGPLQNNGGPTPTHALLTNSPAIDAGNSFGVTIDQRGLPRPVIAVGIVNGGDGSDIGAYEGQVAGPLAVDIGLRLFDTTATVKIACEPAGTLTSPLRISKNGTTYGILLVATNAVDATRIRIQTASEIKAWKKLP